jgi:predicted ATPase/DNA-binding CsgD family transcriptional regulator
VLAEICVRLDGLPLAIELAAARIKLLPPHALLPRLAHRLQVLTTGSPTLPVRQQTLRRTIQWSYDLLDAWEQRLFRRLSVFHGGCTLEAVEALCAVLDGEGCEAESVLDGVESLIEKSLLRSPTLREQEEEPRLHMLETIREYGLECLTTSGETQIARQAHADYYLAFAEEVEPKLAGPEQATWLDRLEHEHENLRMALEWSLERGEAERNMEMALRFGGILRRFWLVHGHLSEGRGFLEEVLSVSATLPSKQIPPPAHPALPNKAPTYPAGLSAREVEVLRLLARGLSDAEIAGHLVVSTRTVNTHLTSIYRKLQVTSRSAATRFAIEHLLV